MADRLVVFGCGGHAKVVIEAVLARTPNREIVILDDDPATHGGSVLDIRVAGGRELLSGFRGSPVVLAVGSNNARSKVMQWLGEQGHELETVIHPAAFVGSTANIAEGVFVSAGAIAIAEARIGRGAIINTAASVDHDCVVGDCAHIAPGVHLCGDVTIGARTLVGTGSVVRPGTSVCDDVILGAGAVVVRDITEPGTFVGNPARRLK
jgi:sugar O-acyltransferase (sialic acid O-acetyltransferase NeuD family)